MFRGAVDFPTEGLLSSDGIHYSQGGYNKMGASGADVIARLVTPRDACIVADAGVIRYNVTLDKHEGCNGTARNNLY